MSEHDEQAIVVSWCDQVRHIFPGVDLIFAIPNGGKRSPAAARWFKKEGLKPGVPDLFLPVARGAYHGLFIEMKYGDGKTSKDQKKWIKDLKKQDFRVGICYSAIEAIELVKCYYREGTI